MLARLSGLVPTIGILPGRAFAGQANLAGMCDLLISLKGTALGMAGPPLVEAALGVKLTPEEIGPPEVHVASGVIDVLVEDEAEAIAVARKYLAYFGPLAMPLITTGRLPRRATSLAQAEGEPGTGGTGAWTRWGGSLDEVGREPGRGKPSTEKGLFS